MPMIWNETTVRWYKTASDYTGYSEKLAALLLERLDHRDSLCDLGCGISLADLELAGHLGQVTCIDSDRYAIEQTRRLAGERGIANLNALCRDALSADGTFDTVMCLFHGNIEDYITRYIARARYRFIAVVHDDPEELVAENKPRIRKLTSVRQTSEELLAKGFVHTVDRYCLEFGQPFTNTADAGAFMRHYQKCEPGESLEACVARCTVPTDDPTYPLYMPSQRRFAVLTIDR